MLFRNALTTLILAAPALANLQARQNNRQGGNNGGNGGNNGGNAGNNGGNNADPNQTLQIDPSVIQPAALNDGQDQPTAGQVASLTSGNNFANFCAQFKNVAITNGQQNRDGSCNPTIMGLIPSFENMPSQSFANPKNNDVLPVGQDINFLFNTRNWQPGFFTNPTNTYYLAPQQLNGQGQIQGHSHVTCVAINGLDDTAPVDTRTFEFFKGLNEPLDGNNQLKATAAGGFDAGTYMCCLMGSAANHQGWQMPVAQRGPHDSCIRFTVDANGGNGGNAGGNAGGNGGNAGGAAGGGAAGGDAAGGGAAGGNGGAAGGNGDAAAGGNGGAAAGGNGGAAAGGNGGAAAGGNGGAAAGGNGGAAGGNGGAAGGNGGAAGGNGGAAGGNGGATGGNGGAAAGGNGGATAGGNGGAAAGGNGGAAAGGNGGAAAGGNGAAAGGNGGAAGGNGAQTGGGRGGGRGNGRGGNGGGRRGGGRNGFQAQPATGRRSFQPSARSRIARK